MFSVIDRSLQETADENGKDPEKKAKILKIKEDLSSVSAKLLLRDVPTTYDERRQAVKFISSLATVEMAAAVRDFWRHLSCEDTAR